jgi:pimeloyl-ACP methyl ester carboxylesterase
MGPFLGGEKTFKLPDYAERFTQQGLAVFLFDYRNFGASDGEPRNLISPWRHLQDWRAALSHVRSLPDINTAKLALWGSSLSGGHVLKIAAEDAQVTAVVSQVPAVDGLASAMLKDWNYLGKATIAGLKDIISSLFLGKPYWIPIVAPPESFAILNTAECETGYTALIDKASAWENKAPARFCLELPFYRPIRTAQRVKCPTLLLLAEADSLIPAKAVEKTARKIANVTLIRLPYNHFTPYQDEHFEENVKIMSNFLVANLLTQ